LEISNAIYINYDKKFVAGKLIASAITYVAAAVIASFFYWR
jgi:Zn-dependent membrane protease YugP